MKKFFLTMTVLLGILLTGCATREGDTFQRGFSAGGNGGGMMR